MRAWQIDRLGGTLRLNDVPVPELRPGSVLVRIEASYLMSYLKAYLAGTLPGYMAPERTFTPGGNAVGIVEALGQDIWQVEVGQRVILSSLFLSSENVAEPTQVLLGITAFDSVGQKILNDWPNGTLAEYALFPVESVIPVEGLEHVDAVQLSLLSRCAIPYGGLLRGRLAPGERVIINGATGAYGSAAVLLALAMGASCVVAAGRNKAILETLVHAGGARVRTVALTGNVETDSAALRTATDGGAHLGFDMVGQANDPNSTLATLNALRRGGRLVLMGSMTATLPLNYAQLMASNLEIIGNFMYPTNAYLRLLDLLRAGLLDISPIVPMVFPLTSLPEAIEAADAARSLECVVVQPAH